MLFTLHPAGAAYIIAPYCSYQSIINARRGFFLSNRSSSRRDMREWAMGSSIVSNNHYLEISRILPCVFWCSILSGYYALPSSDRKTATFSGVDSSSFSKWFTNATPVLAVCNHLAEVNGDIRIVRVVTICNTKALVPLQLFN